MRKRLIEKITKSKKGSLGYTLMEVLVVIGIIAVLCAIAIPAIFAISRALRFAQVNNYAKSIFLAAQQNLTEMRSDGGLEPVRNAGGAFRIPDEMGSFPEEFRTEYVYTVTGSEAFNRVLPPGSVDADLRGDQIVIEYNPITGNVYAVFYYDRGDLNLAGSYEDGALPRDKDSRKKLMVGYYDGSGLNSSQIDLEKTTAEVTFLNGEEGIVQVRIPMPESFYGEFNEFASALSISLTITGEQSLTDATATPSQLLVLQIKNSGDIADCRLDIDGRTVILEYTLDSLANRSSFANIVSNTKGSDPGEGTTGTPLSSLADETSFIYNVLPGENITIQADVVYDGDGSELIQIDPGIISGVNPMFDYMQPAGDGTYVLAISNGRNMQNLNAIAPKIANMISTVVFISDIDWNDTVSYYNEKYGTVSAQSEQKLYQNKLDEAPARALPYFVPIHSKALFGTADFYYPSDAVDDPLKQLINALFGSNIFTPKERVPTLNDELDELIDPETNKKYVQGHANISGSDLINNDGAQIYNLNIDSSRNVVRKAYYAGTAPYNNDCFTGLFSYVNSAIDNIHIVNPIIKGYYFNGNNNPATGALVGATGYNTYISNCSVYLDKNHPTFSREKMSGQTGYDKDAEQNWYGVSGEGAVGGLVGYAKSHRTTNGALSADEDVLAFYNSFAAVNVSGNLREPVSQSRDSITIYGYGKDYGYTNGIGGLVGNSQLTNFYNCYASGNVMATNTNAAATFGTKVNNFVNSLMNIFGIELKFQYSGRESAGAGGFVGTSHGTRYTNCFATGSVTATNSPENLGAGGFVGIMCIDETFAYGNHDDAALSNVNISQRTIFTDCYSVGLVTVDGVPAESFSGANARTAFDAEEFTTAQVADYYRLLASTYPRIPNYSDFYIFKNTYFLTKYHLNEEPNSNNCATPTTYETLQNLPGVHQDNEWIEDQIDIIKNIKLYDILNINIFSETYEDRYFRRKPGLEGEYYTQYKSSFVSDWESATAATTHGYDLNGTYPFSKIEGLDYYGDWPNKPLNVGIAYYENYQNSDTNHFYFDRESTSQLLNGASTMVIKDGYAILSASSTPMTITVNGVTTRFTDSNGTNPPHGFTTLIYTNSKTYYYYLFSDEQMEAAQNYALTTGEFFVPVQVTQDGNTTTYYFNPNLALTQVNNSDNHSFTGNGTTCDICGQGKNYVEHLPTSSELYVRSARQFAQLSEMDNFLTNDYRYIQQLNIDASVYQWSDADEVKLDSIGTLEQPFDTSYRGVYTTVLGEQQYKIEGFTPVEAGIFGVIGENGSVSDLIINCTGATVGATENIGYTAVLAGINRGTIDNVDLTVNGNVSLKADTGAGILAGFSSGTVIDCQVSVGSNNLTIEAPNAGGLFGVVEGTKDKLAQISNVTFGEPANFTANASDYAGGFVGKATYLAADKISVNLKTVSTTAKYAGGLAGSAVDSTFSGNNGVEVVINGKLSSSAGDSTVAGMIATAKNTVLTAMDVTVGSVEGNLAAGFIGTGDNADASNCAIVVTGIIRGTSGAAGSTGTLGALSVYDNVNVSLNGATVEATAGNAAGYALNIKAEAYVGKSQVVLSGYTNGTDEEGNPLKTPNYRTTIRGSAQAAGYACNISGNVGDSSVTGCGDIIGTDAAGFANTIHASVANCYVSPALTADANGYDGNSNQNLTVQGSGSAAGFALAATQKATISNSYTLCDISSQGVIEVEMEVEEDEEETEPSEPSEETEAPTEETEAPTEETQAPSEETEAPTETTAPEETTEPIPTEEVVSAYAFIGINDGTISRCMANVDITDGFSFVAVNNGLITTSYGWYNDLQTREPAHDITGDGKCFNSYIADMSPLGQKEPTVIVFDALGEENRIAPAQLQGAAIAGFNTGYQAYSYKKLTPDNYLYPMLRNHYGNWLEAPQYAWGVAYYEIYEDGSNKLHLIDLSDPMLSEEGGYNIAFPDGAEFNNEGVIVEAGYAMFYNTETGERIGTKLEGITHTIPYTSTTGEEWTFTYDFYVLETDEPVVTLLPASSEYEPAYVDVRFADAIKRGEPFGNQETFQIRTPEQLARIGVVTANFVQSHDIVTTDVTTVSIGNGYTYEGRIYEDKLCTLTINDQTKPWLNNVQGNVKNLDLIVNGNVNQFLFNNVSGNLENLSITTGNIGSSLIGGNLTGNLKDITVEADSANVGSSNAVLVNTMISGTIDNCTLTVTGEIRSTAPVFGSITGVMNGGTISNSSVSAETIVVSAANLSEDNAMFGGLVAQTKTGTKLTGNTVKANLDVTGLNGQLTVIGGLAGVSNSEISGGSVSGQILYHQVSGETVDQVDIGGIIGWMQSGSAEGTEVSGGSILLAEGGAVNENHQYAIGGAVGYVSDSADDSAAQLSVSGISVDTVIGEEWAGGKNWFSTETFGTTDIVNNGAVGMFVGFAGNVDFRNCESTVTANEIYQFVGETGLEERPAESLWTSQTSHPSITIFEDQPFTSDTITIPLEDNTNLVLNALTESVNLIHTSFENCAFYLNGDKLAQVTGSDAYYYEVDQNMFDEFTIGKVLDYAATATSFKETATMSTYEISHDYPEHAYYLSGNAKDQPVYHKLSDGRYARVYKSIRRYLEDGFILDYMHFEYKLWYMDDNNQFQLIDTVDKRVLAVGDFSILSASIEFDAQKYGLYTLAMPTLEDNAKYIVVSGDNAMNASGAMSISGVTTFGGHEDLADYVYTYSGGKLVKGDAENYTVSVKGGDILPAKPEFFVSSITGNNTDAFILYRLNVEVDAYCKIDVTFQGESKFQRQYVTAVAYDEEGINSSIISNAAPEITVSAEEETAPAETTAPAQEQTVPTEPTASVEQETAPTEPTAAAEESTAPTEPTAAAEESTAPTEPTVPAEVETVPTESGENT